MPMVRPRRLLFPRRKNPFPLCRRPLYPLLLLRRPLPRQVRCNPSLKLK